MFSAVPCAESVRNIFFKMLTSGNRHCLGSESGREAERGEAIEASHQVLCCS